MTYYSKALEYEFESFEYKSEKCVKATIISVTEYQTRLHNLYKKYFLINFLISNLYKMKALDIFPALFYKGILAESNILISIL